MSITPASVGPIKELVSQVDLGEIATAMEGWLISPPADMRAAISEWAAERGIETD
jgi:phosphotransferase system enzyme I (PtsP)